MTPEATETKLENCILSMLNTTCAVIITAVIITAVIIQGIKVTVKILRLFRIMRHVAQLCYSEPFLITSKII